MYQYQTHLNVVSLPGLAPQQQSWHTGEEAPEDAAEKTRLVETLGVPVDEAGLAAGPAHTDAAVPAAVTQTLLPSDLRHF